MLTIHNLTYIHPNRELLFDDISLSIQKQEKIALIGNNGTGKSTLLKIMAGLITPSQGHIITQSKPYYIPQHFGQYNEMTVAAALGIDHKLAALHRILDGVLSEPDWTILADDWTIEDRCRDALVRWDYPGLPLDTRMGLLSGGEKTRVFLAGIHIHQPEIVLLDEPTNHLDMAGRDHLYRLVESFNGTMAVVSHDRSLLELLNPTYELTRRGLNLYGGNYDFYHHQKQVDDQALFHHVNDARKALKKAQKKERETLERKQRQDVRGKSKQLKANTLPSLMKKLKNKAESSTAKLVNTHSEKISALTDQWIDLRKKLPDPRKMKMNFEDSSLHEGKILIRVQNLNFRYGIKPLWTDPLSFQITSGERISLMGLNGSGKTTLIRILLGDLQPTSGEIRRSELKSLYIDQDYSLIENSLSVYQQAQCYNSGALPEHEVKIRLHRYLFNQDFWEKPCRTLSGGERMRLMLCCLMISNHAPDFFVLDEPTNNLDIRHCEILTQAIKDYAGTLLVVSHDRRFLDEISIGRKLELSLNL